MTVKHVLTALVLLLLPFAALAEKDNRYIDDISGFSFTVPANFTRNVVLYPATFYGEKHGDYFDRIFADKIYREMSIDAAVDYLRKDCEDRFDSFRFIECEKGQIKDKDSCIIKASFNDKDRMKNKKFAYMYILVVKSGSIMDTVNYISFDNNESAEIAVMQKIMENSDFQASKKSVPLFFSPRINDVMSLVDTYRGDEARVMAAEELKNFPEVPGLSFLEAMSLAEQKRDAEAADSLQRAYCKGYYDWSQLFDDADLMRLVKSGLLDPMLKHKKEVLREGRLALTAYLRKRLGNYRQVLLEDGNGILFTDVEDESTVSIIKKFSGAAADFVKVDIGIPAPDLPVIWVMSSDTSINKAFIGNILGGNSSDFTGVYIPSYGIFFSDKKTGYGTFVHEYIHALHSSDENRIEERHARWVAEMFATTFESLKVQERTGRILVQYKTQRTTELQEAFRSKTPVTVAETVEMTDIDALDPKNIDLFYCIVRHMGIYLRSKGLLFKFYTEYKADYADDKDGRKALEKTLGKDLKSFEPEFRAWVMTLQ